MILVLIAVCIDFIVPMIMWITNSNLTVQSDYTTEIAVDKDEKVSIAVSNAMYHVTSKGFIINKTYIRYDSNTGLFTITCGGAEEAKLMRLKK